LTTVNIYINVDMMKLYLNASEVAKLLKVDRATVARWAQQGKLKGAIRIEKSHQWRIPISAFEDLVKNQK
jgi:excisionase family DNA binding protein